jgi:serine/threonine protein kinase
VLTQTTLPCPRRREWERPIETIHGFELQEKIGENSTSDVWKAYQKSLQRTVSLQILHPALAAHRPEVLRFIDEAKTIARLAQPNTVAIYDAVEHVDACFLVMEYIPGPSIYTMLARSGRFTPTRAIEIAVDVAEALCHAWGELQLVHRNLTTKCIKLDTDGTVKLNYMGQSLRIDPQSPQSLGDEVIGTPYFMAPEQARGEAVDFRADMYGLGCTLYHMLTGQMPFGDHDPSNALRQQCEGYLPDPRSFNQSIPLGIRHAVEKLLMKDPAHRYSSWESACKALKKARSGRIIIQSKKDPQRISTIGLPLAASPVRGGPSATGKKRIVIRKANAAQPATSNRRRIRVVKRPK